MKSLLLLLTILLSSNAFAQCPAAIIEHPKKIFYKGVLNEYEHRKIKGGQYMVSVDNGELSTLDDRKYIKPSKLGSITFNITEVQGKTEFTWYDHFICETLPNPTIAFISSTGDTTITANAMPSKVFNNIKTLTAQTVVPNTYFTATIEHFTITLIGKKNKITTFNLKGNDNLHNFLKVNNGDKVIFTNIKLKIDGEEESRVLDNKVIEIT